MDETCAQGAISAAQHRRKRKQKVDGTCAQEAISAAQHQRKRKQKGQDAEDNIGINNLPDEILIAILSFMSHKEAGRTSVLSRRWRYLWMFTYGRNLVFDAMDNDTRTAMKWKKFRAWVNRVLELHQGPRLDSFIVRFNCPRARAGEIDKWIYFAMLKEVKVFELTVAGSRCWRSDYEFPDVEKLLAVKSAFRMLRSLQLKYVNVKDEVVHHFLASCPCLEFLSIQYSLSTRNLQVVDPIPTLKVLEIHFCYKIQSVEISATNLVSFKYGGGVKDRLLFKKIPNLSELTLIGASCLSFIYEPDKHSSYSAQLVRLELRLCSMEVQRAIPLDLPQLYSLERLELCTTSQVGRSLLFFTSLIKASPLLREFRITMDYLLERDEYEFINEMPFPEVSEAEATTFCHQNLKLVEMAYYIGCSSEEKFLLQLLKVAPSVEKVVIDTQGDHFKNEPLRYHKKLVREIGARTREEAKERAKHLKSKFPPHTQLVVI